MKLQDFEFEKILSIQPEAGKNYLKNMRVLILNADAIGLLRKDLICTLGTEQAKGFLLRYGYACGYCDAVSTMRDFPLEDKKESYRLGALYHTWVGMANVTPIEIHCNEDERSWFFEGIWLNSYEAEGHVKHFGPSTEPVCWSLIGYAGGFRSAYLGERVIYKEVACSAKGDPNCHFVGKTLSEWGDEILPDLAYYQETNLGKALEEAHARIQSQHEILKHSQALHEKLTKMILDGEEMSAIARTLGEMTGGVVIVEDQFFRPVTCYTTQSALGKEPLDKTFFSSKEIFNDWRYRRHAAMLTREMRPVLLPADTAGKPFSRLIAPIVVGREVLGYVCIIKTLEKFTELDQMTLERAATVFALKMMQARAVAEVETRLKGDFVANLLTGSLDSEASLIERARYLGYDLNRPHQVLCISVDHYSCLVDQFERDERQILHFKGQLCEIADRALKVSNLDGLVTARSDSIIVLAALKGSKKNPSKTVDIARSIQERVERKFNGQAGVSIGIGRFCQRPGELSLSYREARKALEISKALNRNNAVLSFDQLGTYGLLFQAVNQQELLTFMEQQLGQLLEYDAKHQSELVETLHLFFKYDGDLKEAARAAAVSVSGFKYRLRKICEVGGFTLKETNKKFDLQMALKIWQVTKAGDDWKKSPALPVRET